MLLSSYVEIMPCRDCRRNTTNFDLTLVKKLQLKLIFESKKRIKKLTKFKPVVTTVRPNVAFDKIYAAVHIVIKNLNYGGCALIKPLCLLQV